MELRWDAVTIDCREPAELAVFWCGLLGVEVRGSFGPYVGLHPMAPGLPRLVLQRTKDPRPAKNSQPLLPRRRLIPPPSSTTYGSRVIAAAGVYAC